MSNELKTLRSQSFEAEVILNNFASRKRIHRSTPINISRFFQELTRKGLRMNITKFNNVFIQLERYGFGDNIFLPNGRLVCFVARVSIKDIGIASMDPEKPVIQHRGLPTVKVAKDLVGSEMITVVIFKDGRYVEARVQANQREEFIKLLA